MAKISQEPIQLGIMRVITSQKHKARGDRHGNITDEHPEQGL